MGWMLCGKNPETGEMMGYGYSGICNHPRCNKEINHGLSYVCGGMHEGGELGCGKYFCTNHLNWLYFENKKLDQYAFNWPSPTEYDRQLCNDCVKDLQLSILKEIEEGYSPLIEETDKEELEEIMKELTDEFNWYVVVNTEGKICSPAWENGFGAALDHINECFIEDQKSYKVVRCKVIMEENK